jgi:hypothetical protein
MSKCRQLDRSLSSFSNTLKNAIAILDSFEKHVLRFWGLQIKDSSRACMTCRGNPSKPSDPDRWPILNVLNVLGHLIQNDGGLKHEWGSTKVALWRKYWQTCGSRAYARVGALGKAKLLQSCVVSGFNWKLSRWPFQKTIAIELDKLQCRMFFRFLSCPRPDGEDIDHYFRRRARLARNVCQKSGMWSSLWCHRVIAWDKHVRRGERYQHICCALLKHHDSRWLLFQRANFVPEFSSEWSDNRNSLSRGRTGTRLNIGRPQMRWADGVTVAEEVLKGRSVSQNGGNALSISTAIREAVASARCFADSFQF